MAVLHVTVLYVAVLRVTVLRVTVLHVTLLYVTVLHVKSCVNLYLAKFLSDCEMFQTKYVQTIKTHVSRSK
jgi:hypothetical protein